VKSGGSLKLATGLTVLTEGSLVVWRGHHQALRGRTNREFRSLPAAQAPQQQTETAPV
jgi:hypothetical protein